MRFAGWCSALIGFMMLATWIFFVAAGQVLELRTEPIRIGFHLAAEAVTAIALIGAGFVTLRNHAGAAQLGLAANGMLVYTAIVSPGYFAQKGEWPLVGVFAVILALAVANIVAYARGSMER